MGSINIYDDTVFNKPTQFIPGYDTIQIFIRQAITQSFQEISGKSAVSPLRSFLNLLIFPTGSDYLSASFSGHLFQVFRCGILFQSTGVQGEASITGIHKIEDMLCIRHICNIIYRLHRNAGKIQII